MTGLERQRHGLAMGLLPAARLVVVVALLLSHQSARLFVTAQRPTLPPPFVNMLRGSVRDLRLHFCSSARCKPMDFPIGTICWHICSNNSTMQRRTCPNSPDDGKGCPANQMVVCSYRNVTACQYTEGYGVCIIPRQTEPDNGPESFCVCNQELGTPATVTSTSDPESACLPATTPGNGAGQSIPGDGAGQSQPVNGAAIGVSVVLSLVVLLLLVLLLVVRRRGALPAWLQRPQNFRGTRAGRKRSDGNTSGRLCTLPPPPVPEDAEYANVYDYCLPGRSTGAEDKAKSTAEASDGPTTTEGSYTPLQGPANPPPAANPSAPVEGGYDLLRAGHSRPHDAGDKPHSTADTSDGPATTEGSYTPLQGPQGPANPPPAANPSAPVEGGYDRLRAGHSRPHDAGDNPYSTADYTDGPATTDESYSALQGPANPPPPAAVATEGGYDRLRAGHGRPHGAGDKPQSTADTSDGPATTEESYTALQGPANPPPPPAVATEGGYDLLRAALSGPPAAGTPGRTEAETDPDGYQALTARSAGSGPSTGEPSGAETDGVGLQTTSDGAENQPSQASAGYDHLSFDRRKGAVKSDV